MKYNKRKIQEDEQFRLNEIATQLCKLRKKTGLSRIDFSDKFDFSRGVVEHIESGKNITLSTLFRFIRVFNLDIRIVPINEIKKPVEKEEIKDIIAKDSPIHEIVDKTLSEKEIVWKSRANQIFQEFKENDILNLNYDFSEFKYRGDRLEYSIVKCPKHGEFKTNVLTILKSTKHRGLICRECRSLYQSKALLMKMHGISDPKEYFLKLVKTNKNLKYLDIDRLPEDFTMNSPLELFCKKHGRFVRNGGNLSESGCPSCMEENGVRTRNTYDIEFVKELARERGGICLTDEYLGTKGRYHFQCEHGSDFFTTLRMLKDKNKWCDCRKCRPDKLITSKGEKRIRDFLVKHNLPFIREMKFPDLRSSLKQPLPYDFYLPNHNLLIEFDGTHHFQPIEYYGGEKTHLRMVENDQIKNKYALENNINLLRIPYTKYKEMKTILWTYLIDQKQNINGVIFIDRNMYL